MTPVCLALFFVAVVGAAEQRITAPGCGQTPLRSQASQFIVGGVEATPYSWPFICSLEYNGRHICGGSLVKNKAGTYSFITAAHCVGSSASVYSISCSMHDLYDSDPRRQRIPIRNYTRHERYNANTLEHDIALMTLSFQPTENSYLQHVCIANSDYRGGEMSTVIGWGSTKEGGSSTRRLQEVSKPIMSNQECQGAYGSRFVESSMVCAGLPEGGKDACQGDSGGPLVVRRNGAWQLVGVVSWGFGCARPHYPGVYADVYQLRNWLNSEINLTH